MFKKFVAIVFVLLAVIDSIAIAQNEEDSTARILMAAGKFAEAKEVLSTRDDVGSRFRFAVCNVYLKNFDDAIYGLEEILVENPRMARVQLELARTLALAGRRREAIKEYKDVLELNPPRMVRENIERQLADLESGKLSISVSAGYEYSDNVTCGTSAETVNFYGLPFALDGAAKAQSDSAVVAALDVDYVHPFGDANWETSASVYTTSYFDWSDFDFQLIRLSTGPVFGKGRMRIGLPAVADYAFFGEESYSDGIGFNPALMVLLDADTILSFSGLIEGKNYFSRDDRDGFLANAGVSLWKKFTDNLSASVGYQYWREGCREDFLSNNSHVISASLSKKLGESLTLRIGPSIAWADYCEQEEVFDDTRHDVRGRFTAVLSKELGRGRFLDVTYSYTDNDSSLPVYEFERNTIGANVRLQF